MTKGKQSHPLQKPVHPMLRNTILAGGVILAVIAIIAVILLNASTSTTKLASNVTTPPTNTTMPTSSLTPTATPTPVDMSDWKSYTDWKYGYSVKLPPEFASYIPTKGYTGDAIDPDGSGLVRFEDTSLSGSYPNSTAKYGFWIELGIAPNQAPQCTTDQECYSLLTNFYKNVPGQMEIRPIQATIFNRQIKGLAVLTGPSTPSPTLEYFYNIAVKGKRFSLGISFDYPKDFQEAQTKDPVINTILSTVTVGK